MYVQYDIPYVHIRYVYIACMHDASLGAQACVPSIYIADCTGADVPSFESETTNATLLNVIL